MEPFQVPAQGGRELRGARGTQRAMQARDRRPAPKKRPIFDRLVKDSRHCVRGGAPRGVTIWGLTLFPSVTKNRAKLLLIAALAAVVAIGGAFGVVAGAVIVESTGQNVPDRIILKAMRAALLAVLGLTVTIVGVLVHASGVTEDPRRPSV